MTPSSDLIAWLSRPESYPHHPATVELVTTHISCVFLAGELVYKLKKPVRFDFLDFSTVERREWACREELRLNRRLAEQVYLEVVPLRSTGEGLCWEGEGEIVDWLVKMRRLPTDQTLEALIQRDAITTEMLDRLAERLAEFHQSLPPAPLSGQEYRTRLREHVDGNRHELLGVSHHLDEAHVRRIHGCQLQMLALEPQLFDARVAGGRVVEGHGDLRPEHVCFTDPPVVFDCVEFSQDFRRIDMADEWSFLAMECDLLGAQSVSARLLEQYRLRLQDTPDDKLWAFYKSYRACVRGKVAALRADQVPEAERAPAIRTATQYLQLAEGYLAPFQRPCVVLVGGLSGTGKTTLARPIAEALGAELLRTDVLRRELFPDAGTGQPHPEVYQPANRRRVYDELFARAAGLLRAGTSVVLDGTFAEPDVVAQAYEMARQAPAPFLAVECVCPPEVAMERIGQRLAQGNDASEARPELHLEQRKKWQGWPKEAPQLQVDTTQPIEQQAAITLAHLAAICVGSSR